MTAAAALAIVAACAEPNFGDEPEADAIPPAREDAAPDRAETLLPDAKAADATVATDAAVDADAGQKLRVFVTSSVVNGDLLGIAGGDALCASLATAANLGGAWSAWLSNGGGPHAIDRLTSAGPWQLITGEMVVATKTELTTGPLRHAIDRDENGAAVGASRVWTGTGPDGHYLTNDCDKWTGGGGNNGRHGEIASTDATWTSAGVDSCDQLRHLYCFER